MNRVTKYAGWMYLGFAILAKSAVSGNPQDHAVEDAIFQSPLRVQQQSRSPASVAGQGFELQSAGDAFRPGVSLLRQGAVSPTPAMRWRLMGTCRQDSGMFRSQDSVGYGDCNN